MGDGFRKLALCMSTVRSCWWLCFVKFGSAGLRLVARCLGPMPRGTPNARSTLTICSQRRMLVALGTPKSSSTLNKPSRCRMLVARGWRREVEDGGPVPQPQVPWHTKRAQHSTHGARVAHPIVLSTLACTSRVVLVLPINGLTRMQNPARGWWAVRKL